MLFLLVVGSLLSTETVQTWLARQLTSYASEELGLDASIDAVKISITRDIELTNVYLADGHEDTLIFVGNLKVHFNGFNPTKKLLKTSRVSLNNGKLYLRKYPQDSVFNFQNFINKLAQNKTPNPDAIPFQWKANTVEIDSMRFIKHRLGCEDSCTNIFIDYSKLSVKDFRLNGGEVDADIRGFTYVDRYRFDLKELNAKAAFHYDYMEVQDLEVLTEATSFMGNARMEYSSLSTLGYFVDSVQMNVDIQEATVSSEEFRQWLPSFPAFGVIQALGHVEGTVNDLKGSDLNAKMGQTTLIGNCSVKNSTHAKDIYIDASDINFKGYVSDYETYIFPLSDYHLPENFKPLQYFQLKGSYRGGLNNILMAGDVSTALGRGKMDITLSNITNPDYLRYNGFIDVTDFQIGSFLKQPDLGNVTLKGQIDGKGTLKETIDFNSDFQIAFLDIYGYRLKNIDADGQMDGGKFSGKLNVNDANLKADFDGLIDFNSTTNNYDFDLNLKRADLRALGVSKDSIAIITSKMSVDMAYQDFNNFEGSLNIYDLTYEDFNNFFFFDSISMNSLYTDDLHTVVLQSQLIDADFSGQFNIADVLPSIQKIAGSDFIFYSSDLDSAKFNLDLKYSATIKNSDLLTQLFVPELSIDYGTTLNGDIKMPQEQLNLQIYSPGVNYKKANLKEVNLIALSNADIDEILFDADRFTYGNVTMDSNKVIVHLLEDSVDFDISTIIRDSVDNEVSIAGHSAQNTDDHYELKLRKTKFNIEQQYFNIVGDNKISWYKDYVNIEGLLFQSNQSNLAINGFLSKSRNEALRFSTDSLDMGILNYFIGDKNTRLEGIMNGDILISEAFAEPKIYTSFKADSLLVNDDWVGDVFVDSDYNYDEQRFEFTANIERGRLPAFDLEGFFAPGENGTIEARARFNRFRVNSFSPFLAGVLEDLKGTVTGDIFISGPIAKPHFEGVLKSNQIGLKVPITQTNYNFIGQQEIQIIDTAFIFPKTEFVDSKEGTKGTVYGSINHRGFSDFYFDLHIDASDLLAMDLEEGDNGYFYGKAYASGDVKIVGPIKELLLEMNLKTEENTDFKMPISGDLEVERSKFVTFTEPIANYQDLVLTDKKDLDLRGLTLRMNINVTPSAKAKLIMDETVGDIISGTGSGNLRLEMNPSGEFEMFGDYELQKGDYLFTMRNIINKPFVLEPGGKLNWKGDPYNAQIDLRAKYSTRTTLGGMVSSAPPDQRVTVDLYLVLKGPLLNPTISFEIELPGASPAWQEELRNRLTNVDRLNQQAFSLLVLNTFWDPEIMGTGSAAGQGLAANSVQVLSNQFSNWINAGTKDFIDINMNYSTGATTDQYDELEIGISKGFYDDRLIVNGILDVPIAGASGTTTEYTSFAGDVEILYKITKDGRIKVKAFNRNNQNNPARGGGTNNDGNVAYTQGIGIQYQKDFDAWGPFLKQFFSFKREPEPKVEPEKN